MAVKNKTITFFFVVVVPGVDGDKKKLTIRVFRICNVSIILVLIFYIFFHKILRFNNIFFVFCSGETDDNGENVFKKNRNGFNKVNIFVQKKERERLN